MNNIAFIIPTFFIISCANPSINVEKEEAAIYSVLIDKMATPFPPPPPPPKDGSYIKPINMDSINKIKVEVVIDTVMLHVRRSFKLDKQFNEYHNYPKVEI